MPRLLVVLLLGGLLAPPMTAAPAAAAPKAELWARWGRHDPRSTTRVDHGAWARFLQLYLRRGADGISRVDYGAVTAADRRQLEGYVAMLAAIPISRLDRDEQMAYWVNLYNALTVLVVLDHYPVKSIRDVDISPGLFSRGPWGKKLVAVEGEAVSLDDIEHRILRPIWRDPRVHYVVNCAALGCPDLPPRPLAARDLDHALDMAAIAFVNHPRGARIENGELLVSSVYIWFEEDFGGDDAGVIRHLMAYADPDLAMRLQRLEEIGGDGFDWRLNDAGQGDR